MRSTFHNLAAFEHKDLIGAANRRELVGNERCAPGAQRPETVLNKRFALAVETRRGFVEDENARVRQDGAGDGDALTLPAGQANPALADNRVVAVFERFHKLVAMGDAADRSDVLTGCVGPRVRDVLGDGTVEEEIVLQHDAQVAAGIAQWDGGQIAAINSAPARLAGG